MDPLVKKCLEHLLEQSECVSAAAVLFWGMLCGCRLFGFQVSEILSQFILGSEICSVKDS